MAEGAFLAGFLAFVAVAGVGWFALRASARTPRVASMRVRVAPGNAFPGPVRALLPAKPDPHLLVESLGLPARQILAHWMMGRGVKPGAELEAARSGALPLHPVLVHLLEGGSYDAWWREEARAAWRGPGFLFPLWRLVVESTGGRQARCIQYLDLVTRKLEETVSQP